MSEQFSFEQLSAKAKESLRRRLDQATEPFGPPEGTSGCADGDAPMSPGQERMWFLHATLANSATFNVISVCEIHGRVDVVALKAALGRVIERHEPLRTSLAIVDGFPRQRVRPYSQSEIRFRQFRAEPERADRQVGEWLSVTSAEPFDLDGDPLLRLDLLSCSADRHILLLTAHHVALDGWSVGVLHRELGWHYAAALGHVVDELPAIRPYVAFAAEQCAVRAGNEYANRTQQLRAELSRHVGTIAPGAALGSAGEEGVTARRELSEEVRQLVEKIALDHGTTPFVVFLAATAVTLRRVLESSLNVVGVPVAGRYDLRDENAIGYYSNTVLVPIGIAQDATVEDCLATVGQYTRLAQNYDDIALQDVAYPGGGRAAEGRQPFSVLFAYQNVPYTQLSLAGTVTRELPFFAPVAHAGLTVNIWHHVGLQIQLEGDNRRLDETGLAAIAAAVECVLRGFTDRTRQVRTISFDGVGGLDSLAPELTIAAGAEEAVSEGMSDRPDLLDLWASLLDRTDVTMSSDFFALGGHSLLAARLIAMVRRDYEVNVPLRAFLKDPTPAGLARFLP